MRYDLYICLCRYLLVYRLKTHLQTSQEFLFQTFDLLRLPDGC